MGNESSTEKEARESSAEEDDRKKREDRRLRANDKIERYYSGRTVYEYDPGYYYITHMDKRTKTVHFIGLIDIKCCEEIINFMRNWPIDVNYSAFNNSDYKMESFLNVPIIDLTEVTQKLPAAEEETLSFYLKGYNPKILMVRHLGSKCYRLYGEYFYGETNYRRDGYLDLDFNEYPGGYLRIIDGDDRTEIYKKLAETCQVNPPPFDPSIRADLLEIHRAFHDVIGHNDPIMFYRSHGLILTKYYKVKYCPNPIVNHMKELAIIAKYVYDLAISIEPLRQHEHTQYELDDEERDKYNRGKEILGRFCYTGSIAMNRIITPYIYRCLSGEIKPDDPPGYDPERDDPPGYEEATKPSAPDLELFDAVKS